jgi:uncharacterized protein HemX
MVRTLLTPRLIVVALVTLAAALALFLMPVGAAPSGQEPYPGETPTVAPTAVEPYVGTPEATETPEGTGAPVVPPPTGAGTSAGNSQSAPLIAIWGAIGLAAGAVVVWRIATWSQRSP